MPRIFDCFLLDDELDALKDRFTELEEIPGLVHVICEAPVTFRGARKPLHFWENRDQFRFWQSRWNHVAVQPHEMWGRNPRERELALREYVLHGATAEPSDIIMFGDASCIPDRSILMDLTLRKVALPREGLIAGYRRDVTTIAELINPPAQLRPL